MVEPFGGVRYRDRFTDAVWQGPTWSFAILLFLVDFAQTPGAGPRAVLAAGFSVVMVVSLVALLVRWPSLPPWSQALLPIGDLLGAAAMVLAVPVSLAPTSMLLCALPGIWLSFEFGRVATAGAVGFVVVLGVLMHLVNGDATSGVLGSATTVVSVLFMIGVFVVARLMSVTLHRVGETLASQSVDLEAALGLAETRLVVMTGVMECIDAGVTVLRPGVEPLHNERAARLAVLSGTAVSTPETAGDRVYLDDGVTQVPAHEQAVLRAVAGEEFAGVVHWVGPPGDQLAVATSARLLLGPDGQSLGTVVASWDATELMNAIRVREEFVTTVSHELRTPLTAIAASLELMDVLVSDCARTPEVDADCAALLAASMRNTSLLGARISELLASTTTEHATFVSRSTDVSDLVEVSLSKHRAAIERAGLGLHVELDAGVVATLDATRFEQVVDNLVSNAIKYTPRGKIRVRLHAGVDELTLSVADSGVGMSGDEQQLAFDRFYRAPGAKATAIPGLGIGLGLVRSIVERHHGSVHLLSIPGSGTTVTVVVPLEASAEPDNNFRGSPVG